MGIMLFIITAQGMPQHLEGQVSPFQSLYKVDNFLVPLYFHMNLKYIGHILITPQVGFD